MNAQDLKNSILQLAIQGKLVEQRKEEGTAKELIEQIKVEKENLIKEKKIKKQKELPEIGEDEIPFDIPDNWNWVRLGDVVNIVSARRVHQSDWRKSGIPFYRAREIGKLADQGYVDNELYIDEDLFNKFSESGVPQPGDLMVTAVGTLGKTYIVKDGDRFYYKDASVICFENFSGINSMYLRKIMESKMMEQQIKSNSGGTTVATLTMVRTNKYVFPLPPLEEQKRIVAKIEELMPYVEEYDKAYTEVEALNKKFSEDMQKSILQYAIQGKLVEQREEDGTAEDLYQQIQEEKNKLIKEGKIKKTKALPGITEDEIPFDIPNNWKRVRLGDLLNKLTDGAHSTPKYTEVGVPFISVKDISSGKMDFSNTKFISQEEHESLYKRCNPERGDILLTKVGTTGIPVIVETDKEFSLFVSVALLKFNIDLIFNKYFMYVIKAPVVQIQARENTRGVGNKNWVMRAIANTVLPLPPFAEQKRIVEKIEELLPYTKQLVKKVD